MSVEAAPSELAESWRKAHGRSRVTNGKRLFVDGDGRTPWARRWRDLVQLHIADLGGIANLSEAQRSLIKRAATIECELEVVEGLLSMGKAQDLSVYATAAAHLRRSLETLGVERRARDMGNVVVVEDTSSWSPMRHALSRAAELGRQFEGETIDAEEALP